MCNFENYYNNIKKKKTRLDWKLKLLYFSRNNVNEVVFIPYAKVNGDYDGYTKMMGDAIVNLGKNLE